MKPEVEAKFLNVDHDELRAKLKALGATCRQPMRVMRRRNFDFPDRRLEKRHGWVRVRDEGDKVTLSYKQLDSRSLQGMKEVSVTVDDFEEASSFLRAIGLVSYVNEESRRESWELNGVEIDLDEWPWIKPFIEIEALDEKGVWGIAEKLDLRPEDAKFGSVEIAYQAEYDVTEKETYLPELSFGPVPDWLEKRRRP